jgi:hypothetical protein
MAHNPRTPQQGNTLAAASLLALASLVAGPALAAPEHDLLCDENHEATLEVASSELATIPANAHDKLLQEDALKPRVEASAREIFSEGAKGTDDKADVEADENEAAPAVPSLSDGQPKPYKRQMYRRDI